MNIATVAVEQDGDLRRITCDRCGHAAEAPGKGTRALRALLRQLRADCPRNERNFYGDRTEAIVEPDHHESRKIARSICGVPLNLAELSVFEQAVRDGELVITPDLPLSSRVPEAWRRWCAENAQPCDIRDNAPPPPMKACLAPACPEQSQVSLIPPSGWRLSGQGVEQADALLSRLAVPSPWTARSHRASPAGCWAFVHEEEGEPTRRALQHLAEQNLEMAI